MIVIVLMYHLFIIFVGEFVVFFFLIELTFILLLFLSLQNDYPNGLRKGDEYLKLVGLYVFTIINFVKLLLSINFVYLYG